jgi:hypothetical protein
MIDKILTWFINVWLFLILIITIFTFARLWTDAPTLWDGLFAIVGEAINYQLYLTVALFSSPALTAIWWREKRRTARTSVPSPAPR